MSDVFNITCSALPETTRVAGFRGTEGVSKLYQFDLYLLLGAEGQDLDLADAIGAKAKLEIDRADGRPPFLFHGIFAEFELVHDFGERTLFHATLVPQLWQLTQTFHSRIFTQKSLPDILKEVLEDGGLGSSDYTLKLSQTYKPEEHVCQYQESHFDFISRWMEREGMYYYFEQGDASEKLVISDSKSFQAPLPEKAVRFFALGGHDGSSREALHTFTCKHRALPASVKLQDYDYTKPTLDVSGSAPVSKIGLGEISVHGSRFFTPDDGKRLAKIRAEELLCRQVVYRGTGTAFYLRPGYFFTLEDHPRHAFDAEYFITDCEHVGNQSISDPHVRELTGIDSDKVYWVEVTAIPSKVQFRAERKAAWPRIYGYENGTVCGPADTDYAQIDDHGRYNVKFKFDESDLKDGKASTWVRMMQPHGGDIEGFHFPLRKGTEIVFSFLGGDPDRPVISGVVPNLHTPSPVTKGNHTRNVLQTGGRNRWELEDKKGQERITMSTPHTNSFMRMGSPNDGHTMIIQTDAATLLNAGANFDLHVGQISGGGTWDCQIKDNWTAKVQGGGWSVGVCSDPDGAAAGKISFKSTSDIHYHTTGGNYLLDVDAGNATNTVSALNHDDFGTWHSDVKNEWEHASASVKWDIKGAVKVECDTWDCTQKGEVSWETIGDLSHTHLANKHELVVGLTTDTMIGIKIETLVGGTADTCIGAKAEITLAAQYEMNAGPKAEFKTMKMVMEELEAKERELALEDAEASIKKIEAELHKHDVEIHLISAIILA